MVSGIADLRSARSALVRSLYSGVRVALIGPSHRDREDPVGLNDLGAGAVQGEGEVPVGGVAPDATIGLMAHLSRWPAGGAWTGRACPHWCWRGSCWRAA